MEELIVALHMHTVYSDGSGTHAELAEAGLRAGVDVLIVTDHNVLVSDIEGYKQEGKRRVPC
jgi:predicted metal-dependent phosphoesterase TrpH